MAENTVTMTMVGRERYVYNDQLIVAYESFEAKADQADYLLEIEVRDPASNIDYNVFVKGEAERPEKRNGNEHIAAAYWRTRKEEQKTARRTRRQAKAEGETEASQ